MEAIPRRFGGRTASILNKCRILKRTGGIDSTIVTLNYSSELDDVSADLRRRGLLIDGIEIVNLDDCFPDPSNGPAEQIRHEIDEPGMEKIRDDSEEVYRYFENGVYRLYKRFDHAGRLIVRDWFNENRGRVRRDEFTVAGTIRRTTYMDLHLNRPRQQIYYRANGVPYLNKWLVVNPDQTIRVERVTEFDQNGRPVRVLQSDTEQIHRNLDHLIGSDHAFLIVESRRADPAILRYRRPNVKRLYVLHNPHLLAPGNDPTRARATYQPLLGQRDAATVFLTEAQRTDFLAADPAQRRTWVIPHPVATVRIPEDDERDPDLVVMVTRFDQQKQLGDAIEAFARVLDVVPSARLEIYGRGADQVPLQQQIDALGLSARVTLKGYTPDAPRVLRRASVSLLTSRFEGLPLALLESLANGCPVVSYDIKYGPSDILDDGVDGFLVPARDRVRLAARVIEILTDPALRRRMSEAAGEIGTRFGEDPFLARWSVVFDALDSEGWDEA